MFYIFYRFLTPRKPYKRAEKDVIIEIRSLTRFPYCKPVEQDLFKISDSSSISSCMPHSEQEKMILISLHTKCNSENLQTLSVRNNQLIMIPKATG